MGVRGRPLTHSVSRQSLDGGADAPADAPADARLAQVRVLLAGSVASAQQSLAACHALMAKGAPAGGSCDRASAYRVRAHAVHETATAVAGTEIAECAWPQPAKWLSARVSAVLAAAGTPPSELVDAANRVKREAHVSRGWQMGEANARDSVAKKLASARAAAQHAQAAHVIGTRRAHACARVRAGVLACVRVRCMCARARA